MEWSPSHNAFLHSCPVCDAEFYGRKNKVYCDQECKVRYNNDLASERRSSEKSLTASMLKNERILKKLIDKGGLPVVTLAEEELLGMGFEPKAPNQRILINGERWFLCGQYAYMSNGEMVEIMHKRIVKKTKNEHSF